MKVNEEFKSWAADLREWLGILISLVGLTWLVYLTQLLMAGVQAR